MTNKRATYDQARNVVAFADLAEHANISNTAVVSPSGALSIPYNNTNTLYNTLNQQFSGARDISTVNQALGGTFVNGTEYEEVESARLLDASEYTVNTKLGYISLKHSCRRMRYWLSLIIIPIRMERLTRLVSSRLTILLRLPLACM